MNIELINDSTELNGVFKSIYDLIRANDMIFKDCLLMNDTLLFILKDPERLFIVEKEGNSYAFTMKSAFENFKDLADESNADELINKFKKRQVF